MNYQRIYDSLIEKRRQEPATGYTENHHIQMKSMGGTDDPSNLVKLTGREHYVAHLLLWKIYKNQQTACACHMMAMRNNDRGLPQIKSSKIYEHIRKAAATELSKLHKGKIFVNCDGILRMVDPSLIPFGFSEGRNSSPSEETRQKMRESLLGKSLSEEHKIKLSKAKIGVHKTSDHKDSISKSIKKFYSSPEGQRNIKRKKLQGLGQMWICNKLTLKTKRIQKTDNIPNGWVKGRNYYENLYQH